MRGNAPLFIFMSIVGSNPVVGAGVVDMNKKKKQSKTDIFVELFEKRSGGKHPNDFKKNPKALAAILNSDFELTDAFREAVEEVTPTEEDLTATGLGNLFPDDM